LKKSPKDLCVEWKCNATQARAKSPPTGGGGDASAMDLNVYGTKEAIYFPL